MIFLVRGGCGIISNETSGMTDTFLINILFEHGVRQFLLITLVEFAIWICVRELTFQRILLDWYSQTDVLQKTT